MNWLSKVVLNDTEMNVKDTTARDSITSLTEDFTSLQEQVWRLFNWRNSNNTIYYVSPSGSDETGLGTEENPYRTISHACDVSRYYYTSASNSVIIYVAPGDYYETITIGGVGHNKRINLYINGVVNIYGCARICDCPVNIFYTDSQASKLHIYYDSTYTVSTYASVALLAIYEGAKLLCNTPIILHLGSGVCDYGLMIETGADVTLNVPLSASGEAGKLALIRLSKFAGFFDASGLTTTGATLSIEGSFVSIHSNTSITYENWRSVIAGNINVTPYTP